MASPDSLLHAIFRSRAREFPDRVALSGPGGTLSYAELDSRSDRLAETLTELGVGPEALVALCTKRSFESIVGMLAILKAGGAYVPIDPSYPADRIDYIVRDCGAAVVVAGTDKADLIRGRSDTIVWIEGQDIDVHRSGRESGEVKENTAKARPSDPGDAAYVIYTSGSSGMPKGVTVEHRNVVRLFEQTQHWFEFGPDDTWALFHSLVFDFSVWEIWGPLLHGGRLVLLPEATTRSPELLASVLRSEAVTVLNQTPSAFHQFLRKLFGGSVEDKTDGLSLRLVILGGERLQPKLLEPWILRHGDQNPRLVNMYGITETTVHCTYRPITVADMEADGTSPIGEPIPDLRMYVLDREARPVPDGQPGELYIAGAGVARGYLNRPDLTRERFLDGIPGLDRDRLYRSGDRAVRQPGGELFYLGRLDGQLKVRGYRIEPGEIEHCLSQVPGVASTVVAPRDFGNGDVRLVAHLLPAIAANVGEPDAEQLVRAAERHAMKTLPRHLRPSLFEVVTTIPLTLQGKVDVDELGRSNVNG